MFCKCGTTPVQSCCCVTVTRQSASLAMEETGEASVLLSCYNRMRKIYCWTDFHIKHLIQNLDVVFKLQYFSNLCIFFSFYCIKQDSQWKKSQTIVLNQQWFSYKMITVNVFIFANTLFSRKIRFQIFYVYKVISNKLKEFPQQLFFARFWIHGVVNLREKGILQ